MIYKFVIIFFGKKRNESIIIACVFSIIVDFSCQHSVDIDWKAQKLISLYKLSVFNKR